MGKVIKGKMFLDELPRIKSSINWKKSVGYKVKFIYDNIEGEIEIIDYNTKTKNLTTKYANKEYNISIGSFQYGQIGKLIGIKTNEFRIEIGQVFKDEKRDIFIVDREYRKDYKGTDIKYYKYKCNNCGYSEGWMTEYHLLSNRGCPVCCKPPQIVVSEINSIVANPETHWMIPYFQGGYEEAKMYAPQSNLKIRPICPDCGTIKNKEMYICNIYLNKSIGCACGDGLSYGHKYVFNLLTQLNQDFQDNKTFDWCRFYNPFKNKEVTGEYDFVVSNKKLIIEVDGDFHRKDNEMSGQTVKESQYLDYEKDRLATENGYKVIRISDENSIKNNIINSELSEIFNLTNIYWNKVEEFALGNRVKEVCEYKKNNPEMTVVEIEEKIKIEKQTVRKYLKKGSELGWCNYDPKEESFRGSSRAGKSKGKQIEIFKDGILFGVFESATEIERQSEELFGIKLLQGKISAVCLDKRKHHKGFTFKYV